MPRGTKPKIVLQSMTEALSANSLILLKFKEMVFDSDSLNKRDTKEQRDAT